jgi:hypothetical protein
MENKTLTTEQSLDLIARMLENTRRNFNDRGGAMFLIWGYTTIAVTIAVTTALLLTKSYDVMWLWCALPVVGGILTWLHFRKHERSVQTHLDKAVWSVWAIISGAAFGCMIASFVMSHFGGKSHIDVLFTIGLMMSIGTAITGRMIKFYPVEFGGFIGIGLSFAILPLEPAIWQLPMFAGVFLFGQVIPGHFLNAHCKREAREAMQAAREAREAGAAREATQNGRAE